MAIEPQDAAASLTDVENIERRTREAVRYAYASTSQLLWGALIVIGYMIHWARPETARISWLVILVLGILGGVVFRIRRARAKGRPADFRWVWGQLAVVAYGFLWTGLLSDSTTRQLIAVWPTFFMFWMVVFGVFFGRFFVILGLTVTALIAVGYLWAGDWFLPWMAVAAGGGLISSGLYLRRIGLEHS